MTRRPFPFKLEPVRRVRKHAEELAMQELAGELVQASELGRRVGAASQVLADALGHPGAGLDAAALAGRQLYLERIERELREARRLAEAQAHCVDAARGKLELAARDREALDRLEARRRAEHLQETKRLERIAADEVSVSMRLGTLGGIA